MKVIFPYEDKKSSIFEKIKRPIASVSFWSKLINNWLEYTMIVDTGSDYTILPMACALDLGINLSKECQKHRSRGIGGKEKVYFLKNEARIKIGNSTLKIPVGFLDRNDIPPLLGRHKCLDKFAVLFANFKTEFRKLK